MPSSSFRSNLGGLAPAYAPPELDLRRLDPNLQEARSFRAFGWFGSQPAIAQRTINESAAVALALSPSDGP